MASKVVRLGNRALGRIQVTTQRSYSLLYKKIFTETVWNAKALFSALVHHNSQAVFRPL
jgi:hypothetical protein